MKNFYSDNYIIKMNLVRPICIYLAFNNLNDKKIIKLKINKLVEDNIKLLYYFGNTYQKRHNLNKDEYNDLIQDGYFGLNRAAEKYDENKNVKFGSYASWWIRACMTKNVKDYYKNKHFSLDERLVGVAVYDQLGFINTSFLSYEDKRLLYLRYSRCLSYKNIGKILNQPQHTVIKKHKLILSKIKIENKL